MAKEKQILLSGYFELIKANVPIPQDITAVLGEVVKSVAVPLSLENQQVEAQIQQAYQQPEQQVQEQGQMNQQQIQQEQPQPM